MKLSDLDKEIIFLENIWQYDKLKAALTVEHRYSRCKELVLVDWKGAYCYSLTDKTYSSTSTRTETGAYHSSSRIISVYDIEECCVLPEKWAVAVTNKEISDTLSVWRDNTLGTNHYGFVHSYYNAMKGWWSAVAEEGYKVITYEDFLNLVLKKRIPVGYKAPYDLFGGRIKKDMIFSEYSKEKLVMYNEHHMTSGIATEIVHTWQPVYEEPPIKIGNYVATKTDNIIFFGCVGISLSDILTLRKLLGNQVNGKLTVHGTEITIEILNRLQKMF